MYQNFLFLFKHIPCISQKLNCNPPKVIVKAIKPLPLKYVIHLTSEPIKLQKSCRCNCSVSERLFINPQEEIYFEISNLWAEALFWSFANEWRSRQSDRWSGLRPTAHARTRPQKRACSRATYFKVNLSLKLLTPDLIFLVNRRKRRVFHQDTSRMNAPCWSYSMIMCSLSRGNLSDQRQH